LPSATDAQPRFGQPVSLQILILGDIDKDDIELEHALAKIPEFGNRVLRVIYKKKASPLKIITVYFDRTMRGKI